MSTQTFQAPPERHSPKRRTARWRAGACGAALLFSLPGAALAQTAARTTAAPPDESSLAAPLPTPATPTPAPADVEARARALDRVIPPEPNPVPFPIPEHATADEFRGLDRVAFVIVLFSGAVVAGTLVALFLSLLRKHEPASTPSYRVPSPSQRH